MCSTGDGGPRHPDSNYSSVSAAESSEIKGHRLEQCWWMETYIKTYLVGFFFLLPVSEHFWLCQVSEFYRSNEVYRVEALTVLSAFVSTCSFSHSLSLSLHKVTGCSMKICQINISPPHQTWVYSWGEHVDPTCLLIWAMLWGGVACLYRPGPVKPNLGGPGLTRLMTWQQFISWLHPIVQDNQKWVESCLTCLQAQMMHSQTSSSY